ncbi:MAG: phosphoribosylformylglycinamidine synthase subunit PurQ [Alphaproteobacteria bacterium]|nr:phosphoribosylformylglycinamidine synthase subunit PurQ [Alphaproteobacteria bacterium]
MRSGILVFPDSNCDRDVAVALGSVSGSKPIMVWHKEVELPALDLIVIPGGFSYGDYLRPGAMAAHAPIMRAVKERAAAGTPVLAICNGFQIACEAGLLPGALLRNASLRYVCRDVHVRVEQNQTVFASRLTVGQVLRIPIGHHDGNYYADGPTLDRLEHEGRIALRYCTPEGGLDSDANPNGSARGIAGIYNESRTVLGLMPHPERLADPRLGGIDGRLILESLVEALA